MKSLVIYHSYSGRTRTLAKKLAEETGAELYEVEYKKLPSKMGLFFGACPAAMRQKPSKKIKPITVNFTEYNNITIMGPIYAGHAAPPVNSVLYALPKGAAVNVRMVSAGGESSKQAMLKLAEKLGIKITEYIDEK